MNTKKTYVVPAMEAVEIEAVSLLAGSGELGITAGLGLRGDIEDAENDE